jgi:hypothetical protein
MNKERSRGVISLIRVRLAAMRMPSLLLVVLCAVAVRGQQPPPAQPTAKPAAVGQTRSADRAPAQPSATFSSVYAASGPKELTADPDSPFWKDIPGVWIERRIDTSEPAPRLRSNVRSRWTSTHLYFLSVCPYEQMNLRPNPQTVSDTNRLWEHDVLEVYIGSNFDDITKYLELQVSPQGPPPAGSGTARLRGVAADGRIPSSQAVEVRAAEARRGALRPVDIASHRRADTRCQPSADLLQCLRSLVRKAVTQALTDRHRLHDRPRAGWRALYRDQQ